MRQRTKILLYRTRRSTDDIIIMDYFREGHIYMLLRNMMASTRRNQQNKRGRCPQGTAFLYQAFTYYLAS